MKSISFSFNDQNATNHGNAPQVQEAHSSSPLPGFLTRWLEDVKTMDPNLAAMLFQFLPPLYLICINYLLLMSLYSAARIEPHFTETGKMLSTLKKSFAYLLFSSLLLPCLGVASVTVLVHHVFNNSTDRYHAFIVRYHLSLSGVRRIFCQLRVPANLGKPFSSRLITLCICGL